MEKLDLIIKNGKVVTPSGIIETNVLSKQGKILGLVNDAKNLNAEKTIDATGKYILPGVIDEHVHLLDMELSHLGSFDSGSAAAAVGGVTTVMEMPVTIPATSTLENFLAKKEVADKKFRVDYALYGVGVPNNYDEIPKMAEAGAIGFKTVMSGSIPGVMQAVNSGELYEIFKAVKECDSIITVHAENDDLIKVFVDRLKAEGRKDIHAFFESQPILQEIEAMQRAILLAKEAGCHLHVVHVSCPEGVELIEQAKRAGQKVSCETGPHYINFSEDDGERLFGLLRFAPPVRSKDRVAKMWDLLNEGKIDTLGSDHGPKMSMSDDNIWKCSNGALGLETMLPVMLSEGVNKGKITLERLVEVLAEKPAKLYKIYPKKGVIAVNSDADFVIVDLEKDGVVDSSKFKSVTKNSPFDGLKLKGMPVMTIVRGKVVCENGNVLAEPGYGEFVRPIK